MKKLLITSVAAVALALPAMADYYVAGGFNGWNPSGNLMTETFAGSGIFQATVDTSAAAGYQEFKITDGTWNWTTPGPNSWLVADGSGSVTISYDLNTYADGWRGVTQRIGVSASGDPGTWTAVGDFNGWNNADPSTAMVAQGSGIYSFSEVLAPGTYGWKAVDTGSASWASISWDNRSINTANDTITVDPSATLVTFSVNAIQGTIKVDMAPVPEPTTLALLGGALAGLVCLRRRQ